MARSKIPDLLFDDILLERAVRISRLCCRHNIRETEFALDRITLFVTHKCNLFCKYCNGPHMNKSIYPAIRKEMLRADITLNQFKKLLKDWAEYNVKYIHFTGGEATLNKNLPGFFKLAVKKSIMCSLTTNGLADIKLYRKLINNGLTEIRISVDSMFEAKYDRLVKKKGAHRKVIQNIKDIVRMRNMEKKNIFIVLNICVGSFNVSNIKSNLKYFFNLDPDDIKLLVIGEQSKKIFPKASRKIVDELLCYSHRFKPDYKLLENKIHTLFRKHARGLKDPSAKYEMHHCYIPLTERTLDARGYYPCSIYLRYYGKQILGINSTFREQQNEIIDFVNKHDCLHDPICKNFCTNCCKKYNIMVNNEISNYILKKESCTSRITETDRITNKDVNEAVINFNRISKIKSMDFQPFIIIKPMGLKYKNQIKNYLKNQKIVIEKEKLINDWQGFSLYLYLGKNNKKYVIRHIARNRAHRKLNTRNSCLFIRLKKGIPEKKLFRIKQDIRNWQKEKLRFFSYKGDVYPFRLNNIHIPYYADLPRENKVAHHFGY